MTAVDDRLSTPVDLRTSYVSADEHLADLLTRHDWLLKRQIARSQARKPADILGFAAISEEEVQRLLDKPAPGEPAADIQLADWMLRQLESEIERRVDRSLAEGMRLPVIELARRFGLTPAEVDVLIACMAVELDRRYERVYGFLHDDMSRRLASPGLAINLYCETLDEQLRARALLHPQSPLRSYRLLDVIEDGLAMPWLSRSIRVDERIVAFVAGERMVDARIARHVAWIDAARDARAATHASPELEKTLQRIVHLARTSGSPDATHGRGVKPLVYINGSRHSSADTLVRGAATELGIRVLSVDVESLVEAGADVEATLFLAFREALLSQAAIYLRDIDRVLESPAGTLHYRALLSHIEKMGSVVFASGEHRWAWPLPSEAVALRIIQLQPDGVAQQLDAWRSATNDQFDDAELYRLISLHPTPVSSIGDVWRMAEALVTDGISTPTLAQLQEACREFAGTPVSTLARRIEPKHELSDLVLPAAQLEQLAAICSQAKHSSIVYGAWNFGRKLSLGRGLNAMFTGQPGTGKTMAAEVIAAELGVEILKIDLSQIVSKYIGETEKNLRQLFEQAAKANAILFFDEADALLGKRSDVKDAHDRYANTETAYLLQKMEEYPGITILATNLRQNMDAAFTRRMRFIVDFPFPEEDDRLRIWRAVWPAEVPLAPDVDLALMARQFRLAGGSIRNVALAAAFLAAEQDQAVSMRHLMLATKRELRKMGRLVNEEEHRRYG